MMDPTSMIWMALYGGWILAEVIIAVTTRTKQGSAVKDRGTMRLLWITIAVSMTLSGFSQAYFRLVFPFHLAVMAIFVMAAGLVIRLIAVVSLGKAFSANVAIRESQTLNQSGIYSWIRHPSYLGLVLIFCAVGLHSGNAVGLLCAFVPPTAALLYRIQVEESALVGAFGPDYSRYMARTKRLIPRVY